jgi:PIN domain nuclease of toxin-antitoxin system
VATRLRRTRTTPLAITHLHALRSAELPRHHRDPFDRLLIAQAQIEGLRLVTTDPRMRRYEVEILDA